MSIRDISNAVTQEFHISITTVGEAKYLIRTEQVEPGVPLAEAQLTWDVDIWLEQAQRLMHGPLVRLLQSGPKSSGLRSPQDFSDATLATELLDPSVMNLGQQLYDALFQGLIRDSWVTAQGIAQNRRQLLRLRLGIKDHRLQHLPWEVMNSGDRSPIGTGTDTTFCRYHPNLLSLSRADIGLQKQSHQSIQVLMVVASPDDQERLALSREVRKLQEELERIHSGRVNPGQRQPEAITNLVPLSIQVTLLEQPGRTELAQTLEQGHFHVLHYAGHSNLGETGGDLYLVSRQTGLTERLSGDDLAGLLVNNGTQLAIFNSCRSAYAKTTDIAGWREQNLAQALVNRGVPGVIAMAERIPDDIAITFTQLFYRNLKAGYTIDLSLNRTRQALLSVKGSDQVYWALPVLYMQPGFDGYLGSPETSPDLLHALLEDKGDKSWSDPAETLDAAPSMVISQPLTPDPAEPDLLAGLDNGLDDDDDDFWEDDDEVDLDAIADTLEATADDDYAEDSAFVGSLMAQLSSPTDVPTPTEAPPSQVESQNRQVSDSELYPASLVATDATTLADRPVATATQQSHSAKQTSIRQSPVSAQTSADRSTEPATFIEPDFSSTPLQPTPRFQHWWRRLSVSQHSQPWLWLAVGMVAAGTIVGVTLTQTRQTETFPTPTINSGDLPQAILALRSNDLVTAANTIEYLLDNDQLSAAQTALGAASSSQLTNPELTYLLGRLQWQQGQKENRDFALNDVLRSWQTSVEATRQSEETLANRIKYKTALGFAYYAQDDFAQAAETWKEVNRLYLSADDVGSNSVIQAMPVDAYAGLAIVLYELAQTAPNPEQSELIRDARKSYCLAVSVDPNRFGSGQGFSDPTSWLWGPEQIADWQAVGATLANCQ